ncbi:flagellar protein FlaG|uniref:Flagellar protein FlaG n=1 Tax=Dendrosporobacter quercicolus TaxID=146817 RepID=A0A1G9WUC0_9FIRM|nr:flagellar protein FlaG [Dendrosporobacter quercicolus]NSL49215.1 flagellar protein FlaG [Dendrosporobacter quercicolus DSM 1736]SDM88048.1 flagellar protein FlaG [Dendrosporobacter quercicolus]
MSISASVNLISNGIQPAAAANAQVGGSTGNGNVQPETIQAVAAENRTNYSPTDKSLKKLTEEEMDSLTQKMTKLMELINSDIHFQLHEETDRIMVQVIDTRDGTVLKEFPPHELLDTLGKIKEYVGILLDKKA